MTAQYGSPEAMQTESASQFAPPPPKPAVELVDMAAHEMKEVKGGKQDTEEEDKAMMDVPAVSHDNSKESEGREKPAVEEADVEEAVTAASKVKFEDKYATEGKGKNKPLSINTTHKRTREGEAVVGVDDDTPKHININHPLTPGSGNSGAFHYPSKRSRLSEDANDPTVRGRHYFPPEDRQDQPTAGYHHDGGYQERYPGPVLSQAPSQGSFGGGIQASWLTPGGGTADFPESASYLENSKSLSWEVPGGISGLGSTLSFSALTPAKSQEKTAEEGKSRGDANEEEVEDADIPPLPSTGSNFPPRKREVLPPRPSDPASKLFEPPHPEQHHDGEVETREPTGR